MSDDQTSATPPDLSEPRFTTRWNPRFQIRLVYICYVIAMLASSLATFGQTGLIPGCLIVMAWTWVFLREPRSVALLEALAVLMILSCLCCMGLPAVSAAREAARRSQCSNNLKQIALALHNYHDVYKSFPPAYLTDGNGQPMHSWRVLILPFMEEQTRYDKYRFDEPWDGPNNRKLALPVPTSYQCPSNERHRAPSDGTTSYVAVVGPSTVWPGDRSRSMAEVRDGTRNTLMVIESHAQGVHWMEPRDVDYDTAIQLLTSAEPFDDGHWTPGFFYDEHHGRNAALADGSVRFVTLISRELAATLLQVDDGSTFEYDSLRSNIGAKVRRTNFGNWFRLGIFLFLMFLPLPWVARTPNKSPAADSNAPESA